MILHSLHTCRCCRPVDALVSNVAHDVRCVQLGFISLTGTNMILRAARCTRRAGSP